MPKKYLLLISALAAIGLAGRPSLAAELEYKGYLRAPVGSLEQGGKEIQILNPGSEANEFRLGNETAYAEAYFTAYLLRPASSKDPFFSSTLTFAYNPSMNSQYGDTSPTTDNVEVVQFFVKGGHFDDVPMSYWAGKRFYRDGYMNMGDFFYFANMSGNGAGIEDIEVGNGTIAVALLQSTTTAVYNSTNGFPTKHALDLRWRDLRLADNDFLYLWLADAYSAPGTGTINVGTPPAPTTVNYDAAQGAAGGGRWQHNLDQGFNNFAVVYGNGILENLSLDGDVYVTAGTQNNHRRRWRAVEHFAQDLNPKWGLETVLAYEGVDNGATTSSQSRWYSAGLRPTYYFTDHYHLVAEFGYSIVHGDAETGTNGAPAGDRTMTRATLAPEFAIGRGMFTRPVIRAYVSYTRWNDANKDLGNTNSLIANLNNQSMTALNGQNDVTQIGFVAEVWY